MHGWFNIRKSVKVLCHINKLRVKKPHDHSQQRMKNALTKSDTFFMIKVLERWGIKNTYISIIKAIYSKLIANIKLNTEEFKVIPPVSGTRQGYPVSPYLFDILY